MHTVPHPPQRRAGGAMWQNPGAQRARSASGGSTTNSATSIILTLAAYCLRRLNHSLIYLHNPHPYGLLSQAAQPLTQLPP